MESLLPAAPAVYLHSTRKYVQLENKRYLFIFNKIVYYIASKVVIGQNRKTHCVVAISGFSIACWGELC